MPNFRKIERPKPKIFEIEIGTLNVVNIIKNFWKFLLLHGSEGIARITVVVRVC